jgi:DNA polymerase-3 subunit epsilon
MLCVGGGIREIMENDMNKFSLPQIVFFDLETTGLDPKRGHRVIELAAIAMDKGDITLEYQTFVRTDRQIPKQATEIHGITNEMLSDQPTPGNVYPAFKEIIKGKTLVAHNVKFDMAFLRMEFARMGMQLNNPSICTLEMSRKRLPHLPNHKLGAVYRYLTGKADTDIQQHRALDDARMVAAIWAAMEGQ